MKINAAIVLFIIFGYIAIIAVGTTHAVGYWWQPIPQTQEEAPCE